MWLSVGLLSVLCLGVPALGVYTYYGDVDFMPSISQYFGLVGLMMMAFCHILATRWSWVEWSLRGLDKTYWVHKWLGISALVVLVLHN